MDEELKNNSINSGNNSDQQDAEKKDISIDELKQKIVQLEKERDEYLSGWQRARADLSNYKKDELLRFSEFSKYAIEKLVLDLIPVLDSFDLGIAAMEKSGPVDKGIYMIKAKLEDVLKNYGLKRINIEIGKELNPEIAEPIIEVESDKDSGIVLEEVEAGYK
ncbi:MAG: nucleotide exchange factor GrpE, partial [Patescibacteria group bacterium]|nr:nucleotide exchange factor GrpE [Patescibacteria group bacterium]